MKKRGYVVLTLMLAFILMLQIVSSAEPLGIFTQDSTISLHQICNNCTSVNVTSMTFPNGTLRKMNLSMSKDGEDYNLSFSDTQSIGDYRYNTCGDLDGIRTCENIAFTINRTGEELTEARSSLYILLTVMVFILFIALLFFNIIIPYKNKTDVRGDVIRIVRAKYLKIALIPITHAVFNWFLNLLISISRNLITGLDIYFGMISFVFNVSMALVYVVWVFCLIWFFFNWIRDFNFSGQIKKFGRAVR